MRSVRSIMASSAAIAVATTSLFIAPASYAQDETAQNSAALGEIVVTAQRREQSLLDVPLAVSALGGDDYDQALAEAAMARQPALQAATAEDKTVLKAAARAAKEALTAFLEKRVPNFDGLD